MVVRFYWPVLVIKISHHTLSVFYQNDDENDENIVCATF